MSRLGPFPTQLTQDFAHPVLRYIDAQRPDRVEVEIARPKDVVGYKAAKLYLYLRKEGVQQAPAEYAWDGDLNFALLQRGIKSISLDSEKVRFALDIRYRFKRTESRYGDGFFNSVLMMLVRELGFNQFPEIQLILPHIHTNQPHAGGNSLQDCREAITTIFGKVMEDLQQRLGYPQNEAEDIVAGALAQYLDERFTVSDRIRLGWT